MSANEDDTAAANTAINSLWNIVLLRPYPTEEESNAHRTALKCYLRARHPAPCPEGCRTGVGYLAENNYISGGPNSDNNEPYGITDRLIIYTAYFQYTGEQVDWEALSADIDAARANFAHGHTGDTLKSVTTRLIGHWVVRDNNENAPPPPPNGPPPLPQGPPPTPPPANDREGYLTSVLTGLLAHLERSEAAPSAADATAKVLQKFNNISIDNNFGVQLRFNGDTSDKDAYPTYRLEFCDRAERLEWDQATRVRHFMSSWGGPARLLMQAEQYRVRYTDSADMFVNNFDKLLRWSDETYMAGGSTYFLDFRQSSFQRKNEQFQAYVARVTVDRGRFNSVHKEFLMRHLAPRSNFLPPRLNAQNDQDIPFGAAADKAIDDRLQAIRDFIQRRTGEGTQFSRDPDFRNMLSLWYVEDHNDGRKVVNEDLWARRVKVDDWIHLNHGIIDGMEHQNAKREAYKERDRVFANTDLSGKSYWEAANKLILAIVKIEARYRGLDDIYRNSNTRPATVGALRARSRSRSSSAKGKKGKKAKAKVHAITNESAEKAPATTEVTTTPQTVQTAAVEPTRGRPGRPRSHNPNPFRAPGETWKGDDGLIRTKGATCSNCGYTGHKTQHCGRQMQVDRQAHSGAIYAEARTENAFREELRQSNELHH